VSKYHTVKKEGTMTHIRSISSVISIYDDVCNRLFILQAPKLVEDYGIKHLSTG
jgi:hypothetical protein